MDSNKLARIFALLLKVASFGSQLSKEANSDMQHDQESHLAARDAAKEIWKRKEPAGANFDA